MSSLTGQSISNEQAELRLLRAHNEALQRCATHPNTASSRLCDCSQMFPPPAPRGRAAQRSHSAIPSIASSLRTAQLAPPQGPGHLAVAVQGAGARADAVARAGVGVGLQGRAARGRERQAARRARAPHVAAALGRLAHRRAQGAHRRPAATVRRADGRQGSAGAE
eukprot:1699041-Prymnesium_polylepis.1